MGQSNGKRNIWVVDALASNNGADIIIDDTMAFAAPYAITEGTQVVYRDWVLAQTSNTPAVILNKAVNSLLAAGQPKTFFIDISVYTQFDISAEIIVKSPSPTGKLARYSDILVEDEDTNNNGTGTFTGWNVTGHSIDGTTLSEDLIIIITGGRGGISGIPTGMAGGDLSGTYPNPAVAEINGITKSFYDPTSSIQGQLNALNSGKEPTIGYTPYPNTNPAGFITAGAIPSDLNAFANSPGYLIPSTLYPARHALFGKTGAASGDVTYSFSGSDLTIRVGCWVRILGVSSGFTIKASLVFTDENNTAQSLDYFTQGSTSQNLSTIAFFAFPTMDVRMKNGTTAGIQISVVTGTGTITYDYGGTIQPIG